MTAEHNFITEMDALIEAHTQGSDWVPAIVAAKIIASANRTLLDGWLRAMAAEMLTAVITRHERSTRTAARARAGARAFEEARADAEAGDASALSSFAVTYAVDKDNTRRRVADMTGKDHKFVADDYAKDARPLLLLAEFHRQIAKKVGRRRTGDVFTEDQYDRMYRSITRTPPATAVA